jgi:signal transduction histidine kinase
VLAFAKREIAEHQITVRTEIPNELPSVWGDRVQLQQVLFNLVMNGIDSIVEAHGGRLWVQANEDEGATLYCSLPVML